MDQEQELLHFDRRRRQTKREFRGLVVRNREPPMIPLQSPLYERFYVILLTKEFVRGRT